MSSLTILNNLLISLPERAVRFKVKYKVADVSVIYLLNKTKQNKSHSIWYVGYIAAQRWILTAYSLLDCLEEMMFNK